jgi:precorrin-2 dehydrogenase / sirohydrochlorin ferrochelatase
MKLFPMFLKLEGRRCLVVGAGSIAESKIAGLVDTRSEVVVVAPEATAAIQELTRAEKIEWRKREFRDADLDGMFLVVAATSSPELHERIFQQARRGVLCNIVDVPELCDFYYPAIVQRGNLQIAVSTAGQSPALAQRLRKELESQFGPEYAEWLMELGQARDEMMAARLSAEERKQRLHALVTAEAFEEFLRRHKNMGEGREAEK